MVCECRVEGSDCWSSVYLSVICVKLGLETEGGGDGQVN